MLLLVPQVGISPKVFGKVKRRLKSAIVTHRRDGFMVIKLQSNGKDIGQ
jgi:hypothetical protein